MPLSTGHEHTSFAIEISAGALNSLYEIEYVRNHGMFTYTGDASELITTQRMVVKKAQAKSHRIPTTEDQYMRETARYGRAHALLRSDENPHSCQSVRTFVGSRDEEFQSEGEAPGN